MADEPEKKSSSKSFDWKKNKWYMIGAGVLLMGVLYFAVERANKSSSSSGSATNPSNIDPQTGYPLGSYGDLSTLAAMGGTSYDTSSENGSSGSDTGSSTTPIIGVEGGVPAGNSGTTPVGIIYGPPRNMLINQPVTSPPTTSTGAAGWKPNSSVTGTGQAVIANTIKQGVTAHA